MEITANFMKQGYKTNKTIILNPDNISLNDSSRNQKLSIQSRTRETKEFHRAPFYKLCECVTEEKEKMSLV